MIAAAFRRRSLLALPLAAPLALPLAGAGCGSSTDPSLYTLSVKPGPALTGGPKVVLLREIGLASYLDRREIVRSADDNKLAIARNDWWGEPLGSLLARVLVVGLSQRLPQSNIYNEGGAIAGDPNAVLAVNIQRLDVSGSTLELLAQAAIEFNRPRRSAARTFAISRPVTAATVAAQVAATGEAVAELTDGLAALLKS
ncbi:MAG: membrane integrity-associated transporter subunit PqiC [Enhydrobacter sp.]|nr:MAG: membrane integrity-associated transporter subunit PqiC [Enhydrobacter sp.]